MHWIPTVRSISKLFFHALPFVTTPTNLISMKRYTSELFSDTTCFWTCSVKNKLSLADCTFISTQKHCKRVGKILLNNVDAGLKSLPLAKPSLRKSKLPSLTKSEHYLSSAPPGTGANRATQFRQSSARTTRHKSSFFPCTNSSMEFSPRISCWGSRLGSLETRIVQTICSVDNIITSRYSHRINEG